jgi:hypothetical protein
MSLLNDPRMIAAWDADRVRQEEHRGRSMAFFASDVQRNGPDVRCLDIVSGAKPADNLQGAPA